MNVAGTDHSQSRLELYCGIIRRLSEEKATGFVDLNRITGEAVLRVK